MIGAAQPGTRDRIKAAVAAAALQLLIGYGLIYGLSVDIPQKIAAEVKVFNLPPPRPITIPAPRPLNSRKREGAASPRNLRATPTEIVRPLPVVPQALPPPIAAAPRPGLGREASAGSSKLPGPGTGSGGWGSGVGSGGAGAGAGGQTRPIFLSGRIGGSDYPREARAVNAIGTVAVSYIVVIGPH